MNAFCTVVTPSHLHLARALAKSLETSENSETLYVLLVNEDESFYPEKLHQNIKIIKISELNRELPENMCWYFDNFELCNALKPFIVEWVFQQGFKKVIFLDADIYVVSPFAPIWETLNSYPLLLTPHHIYPPTLGLTYTDESAVADMGIFNGGFAGWSAGEKALKMLDWMCTRFPVYGFCDRKNGMFVDQKLLPLLIQYFHDTIGISKDPRLNIAFWNCHERIVSIQDEIFFIEGNHAIFFHMSGFRLTSPSTPCSYLPPQQNAQILTKAPWLSKVMQNYVRLLQSYSDSSNKSLQPFSKFNGIKLTPNLRRILFKKGYLKYQDREVLVSITINGLKKIKQTLFPYRNA